MAQHILRVATTPLFARVVATPAVQSLARRLEDGGVLSCPGLSPAAHPFLAVLLNRFLPRRPVVVVTDSLRAQELAQQDLLTWLALPEAASRPPGSAPSCAPLFYPAWDVLPHEARLPHSDTISDRLETLVSLAAPSSPSAPEPTLIVTNVVALLQRTFSLPSLTRRIRRLAAGDRADPLDLVEWLEDQGYEPEAQVTRKGELALRGGILDLYPPTSPWPVRIEFFGDELESLRYFDPLLQTSREAIQAVTLPPAGELGLLKRLQSPPSTAEVATLPANDTPLATLIDYLPRETILLLCEPQLLADRAEEYATQIPAQDPFFIHWDELRRQAKSRGITLLEASQYPSPGASEIQDLLPVQGQGWVPPDAAVGESSSAHRPNSAENASPDGPRFQGLDAYRPVLVRTPDPQVAEVQRREFFSQIHRWLRQDYAVSVFCNNDGERQRFNEIWAEYGLGSDPANATSPSDSDRGPEPGRRVPGAMPRPHGAPGCSIARLSGRRRPVGRGDRRRDLRALQGATAAPAQVAHAQATRSALDIDFTEMEEGDYVVHFSTALAAMPACRSCRRARGPSRPNMPVPASTPARNAWSSNMPRVTRPSRRPSLYVPVTEAHLVSKYVGTGKARPTLNTLGRHPLGQGQGAGRTGRAGCRRRTALHPGRPRISAGPPLRAGHAVAAGIRERLHLRGNSRPNAGHRSRPRPTWNSPSPWTGLICGDVGFGKTEVGDPRRVQGGAWTASRSPCWCPRPSWPSSTYNTFRERMADYPIRVELLSRFRTRGDQRADRARTWPPARWISSSAPTGSCRSDIGFKDLGLVVIDEEQRFGVMHKEKFKMLRRLVDVLTLSATPIPRTLYLALTGARDMSTIQTPPHDRLPGGDHRARNTTSGSSAMPSSANSTAAGRFSSCITAS